MKGDDPTGQGGTRTPSVRGRQLLRSPGEALQPETAPLPPTSGRKKRPLIATASGVFSFLGIAAIAMVVLLSLGLQRINGPGPLPADKVVYIEAGTDKQGIVDQLEREGVIDSWPLMTGALLIEGNRSKIKAGEYLFKQQASLRDVIDTLVSGKQILHSITIPEGLTSDQIANRLRDDDILVGDIKTVPKEGTLMPDTFKFARGTKRDQILSSMQQEQKRVVAEVWARRSPESAIKSPFEMVTLASIVEKETGRADERPRVAGVFVNRLVKNMPLQSDPTIVYGLVGGKGTLGRGILKSELEQKTPYNTYTIAGLPPGPICNPGRAAMEASINPARTKEIFFVADGTGGHAFAETLDQHRLNVQKWRQIEKDAKDKAGPDADKLIGTNPPGPVPPKVNQRGDKSPTVPVYGALNGRFEVAAPTPASHPSFATLALPVTLANEARETDRIAPMMAADAMAYADNPVPSDAGGDAFGSSAEERALENAGGGGSMLSFPVSAARRANEKAQAAQFGLSTGADASPPQQAATFSVDPASSDTHAKVFGKGRVVDASEGTRLDPLLDKTYDLNTPKTVPALQLGGMGGPAKR